MSLNFDDLMYARGMADGRAQADAAHKEEIARLELDLAGYKEQFSKAKDQLSAETNLKNLYRGELEQTADQRNKLSEQLSAMTKKAEERDAIIARQAEALGAIAEPSKHLNVWAKYAPRMSDDSVHEHIAAETLSASAESVAEWEAKMMEPLQRQVAMMRHVLEGCRGAYKHGIAWNVELEKALADTQATAEAYDREHAAKVLEEAVDICNKRGDREIAGCLGAYDCADLLSKKAYELRAQSPQKKEGEV